MQVTREVLQQLWDRYYVENNIDEMLDVLERVNRLDQVKTVLEIGTAFGGSLRIWEQLVPPDEGMVITIDIYGDLENRLTGKTVERRSGRGGDWELGSRAGPFMKLKSNRQVYALLGDSARPEIAEHVADLLNGRQIDFIFHDGQHYGPTPVYDYQNFQGLLRDGGLLCIADVSDITIPSQIVPNCGCQALALELPEPKLPKVSNHFYGMCLWNKPSGYVFEAVPVVEKYNLTVEGPGAGTSINPATYY